MSSKKTLEPHSRTMNFSQYLDYVDNAWAKGWLQHDKIKHDGIFVSRDIMKAVNGNPYDAIILSQVLFWAGIDSRTLQPRMRHQYKDHLWIVKTVDEWCEEVCFNSQRTVSECLNRLAKNGMIYKEVHKSPFHETGQVASYVRPNWKGIEKALDNQMTLDVNRSIDEDTQITSNVNPGITSNVNSEMTLDVNPIYTKTTTKTTTKEKDIAPVGATGTLQSVEEAPVEPEPETKKERKRNHVFEAVSEHVFGIPDVSALEPDEATRVGAHTREAKKAFEAAIGQKHDVVCGEAIARYKRHLLETTNGYKKINKNAQTFRMEFKAYLFEIKEAVLLRIHTLDRPKPVIDDASPIVDADRQQAIQERIKQATEAKSGNGQILGKVVA